MNMTSAGIKNTRAMDFQPRKKGSRFIPKNSENWDLNLHL